MAVISLSCYPSALSVPLPSFPHLGESLRELPAVAGLRVDLGFVAVRADSDLCQSALPHSESYVCLALRATEEVYARERSGLKATPVKGPRDSW